MTIRARRWPAAALLAVSVALGVAMAPEARAEGGRVLFVASSSTPFSARVRAEIEAMGFEVEPAATLAEDEATTSIAAARVIESPPRRVELWITDPSTRHLGLRAFVMPSPDDDEAIQTVRASEQLRAFFQPLREHGAPPPAPPPIPPPLPAPAWPSRAERPEPVSRSAPVLGPPVAPAARPHFVVGAEVAVPFQSGGPGVNLGLDGRWMATEVVGLGAFASVPLAGSMVKGAQGSASVSAPLFGADLTVVGDFLPRVRLSTSAGLGLAWVRTSGFAGAPYTGKPSDVTAALALLGAEVAPRLTERTHLYLAGRLGFSLPRVDIAFAGHTVAVWGRPLGLLSAGVSVDL